METGFNILDVALLILLGFFVIRGIVRGFVREIVGLVGMVVAMFLGVAAYRPLADFLRRVSAIDAGWWDGVAFAVLVLVVLGFFIYLASTLARLIHAGPFSGLDRLLGSATGLAKGVLISYLLLNTLLMFLPTGVLGQPGGSGSLVSNSVVAPRVIQAGRLLLDLMPSNLTRDLQQKAGLLKPQSQSPQRR